MTNQKEKDGMVNIAKDVFSLKNDLDNMSYDRLVVCSGGFDPLHIGHAKYILEASKLKGENGILVVICNSDSWLKRKKGYSFMPESERLFIAASLKGVDYAVPWDDGSPTVVGALKALRPTHFAKGGDRDSAENVPEFDVCKDIGCEVVFGVGGGKIQSSSTLVERFESEQKV